MNEEKLTRFQSTVEEEILRVLNLAGRSVKREIVTAEIPFFSKDPQTVIHIASSSFEVWLFDDGANLLRNGNESRFERPDFDSLEELQRALLKEIQSHLSDNSGK